MSQMNMYAQRSTCVPKLLSRFMCISEPVDYWSEDWCSDDEPELLVGRRISVMFSKDRYVGLVKSYDAEKGMHHVIYDDGDEKWYSVGQNKCSDWFLVPKTEPDTGSKPNDEA